jgi:hypothetical protein
VYIMRKRYDIGSPNISYYGVNIWRTQGMLDLIGSVANLSRSRQALIQLFLAVDLSLLLRNWVYLIILQLLSFRDL